MYKLKVLRKKKKKLIEILNANNGFRAVINLNRGGALQELKINNKEIIKDFQDFSYEESFASSLLFPFVNRIEKGRYNYQNIQYQLDKNESSSDNAIHGLIYNQEFSFLGSEENNGEIKVNLSFAEKNKPKGFPFDYKVFLIYCFSKNGLSVEMLVKNLESHPIPFTLGWHPYFHLPNPKNSFLEFKSSQKVEFDQNQITKNLVDNETINRLNLFHNKYDDCYTLKENEFKLFLDEYSIRFSSDSKQNYLQIYTPPGYPLIAVEPMVGISNSFNNKIGLQILHPNKPYSVRWSLLINTL